jgi:glyoxylase-like metal-dependent hydrolase (beta-lactamase superfamily II)
MAHATLDLMKEAKHEASVSRGKVIHEILPVGMLQCNCSIVGDTQTREALVLDPGDEVSRILELLRKHQLTVKAIVSTHAHIDHVGGLRKLREATGAPVLMHADDLELYNALERQAGWLGMPTPGITEVDTFLKEGDFLRWGPFEARVLHTPGHTRGSLCLYLPENADRVALATPQLFAGDTLFAGSIGRTDLWGGSFEDIMRSIRLKLLELPDETVVFPGHGCTTTIGQERESNPFLK